VIKDIDLDTTATTSDKLLGLEVQKDGKTSYLFLDLHVDGMTVEELIAALKISTSGSRVQTKATATNTKTVNGKEIITTGSVLTISATNSSGKTTQEYVIIIDGDVNCDGYVNSADAIYLAWHYCDVTTLKNNLAVMAATGHFADGDVHANDAINIVFKYLYWKAGNDRYVSKFGS
jgi:hypothetical protein